MKQNLPKGSLILLFTFVCAIACKKSIDQPNPTVTGGNGSPPPHDTTLATTPPPVIPPYPVSPPSGCNYAPDYGDSIVYSQPTTSGDFYVYPQNNQGVNGTYLSWPVGLSMNSKTGAIDLTTSETGQRYSVAFVNNGTTDTCMAPLIVAGAAYMDSIYVLSQGNDTAKPYFNANPYAPPVCPGSQGGPGCQFDYNNYAANQGIVIDNHTGYIDLRQTMQKSIFNLLPINGTTVYTTIYYKLSDNSNYAPQKIQLQLMYYNHKSDVPPNILTTITTSLINTLTNLLISKSASPRPPIIIIVRDN
jgi:hypothetical protein